MMRFTNPAFWAFDGRPSTTELGVIALRDGLDHAELSRASLNAGLSYFARRVWLD
jgi:hypothetical protein